MDEYVDLNSCYTFELHKTGVVFVDNCGGDSNPLDLDTSTMQAMVEILLEGLKRRREARRLK